MSFLKGTKYISVCFITPKAYPLFRPEVEGVFGGAEVDMYLLALELARDPEYQVSSVVADYGQTPQEIVDNVSVIKSVNFKKNPLTGATKIWQALKQAGADIYIIESASWGVPLVAAFCRRHRKILIYRTAHTYECDGTFLREKYFLGRAFKWALSRAHMVITQNECDQSNLKRTIDIESTIIPNWQRLPPLEKDERNIILWVGRTAPFKKPHLFLELAGRLPSEKFVMICQKATGDRKYEELCRATEPVSNLEFHQRIPFHEIDNFFQRARVLVNTSDSEGFPNVFVQACKWSVPILSLNVNPDGFLDQYSCGLSCDGDMSRLEQGLKFLLENDRCLELGQNARRYAEERHDIKKIVEQYKDIFRNLLAT